MYEELDSVFDKFLTYHMNLLLGDFNAKLGTEDIFKQTIRNENSHDISNIRVRIGNRHIKTSNCQE
jgi:hypothetical protein